MRKKIAIIILSFSILAVLIAGCGDIEKEKSDSDIAAQTDGDAEQITANEKLEFTGDGLNEATTIRIGYAATVADPISSLEPELKNLEKEFASDGIAVELIAFDNGAGIIESLNAGALDLSAPIGDMPLLTALANESPITVIARGKTDPQFFQLQIPAESDISSAEDLKGKTVAAPVGTSTFDFLLRVLDSVGLTEEDINLVNLSISDNVVSFESGAVDALANTEPNASILVNQLGAKNLELAEDIKLDLGFFVANNDFLEKNPELTARFLKVILKNYDFIQNNPQEATQMAADVLEVDYDTVSSIERWECDPDVTEDIIDQLEQTKAFLISQDTITDSFDIQDVFDGRYLEEASKLYGEE